MPSNSTSIASLTNFTVPLTDSASTNGGTLMPKLKYRFRVTFDGFGVSTDITSLTKHVSEASRPNLKFENKVIDVYNSKINYAAKPTWEPISLKIRDDAVGSVTKIVAEQNQKQFDFYEQSSAAAAGDYKFTMTIEMLDGGNGKNTATVLETWKCYGCYIESTNYNQLSYADGSFITLDLSIRPDNCQQEGSAGKPYVDVTYQGFGKSKGMASG